MNLAYVENNQNCINTTENAGFVSIHVFHQDESVLEFLSRKMQRRLLPTLLMEICGVRSTGSFECLLIEHKFFFSFFDKTEQK